MFGTGVTPHLTAKIEDARGRLAGLELELQHLQLSMHEADLVVSESAVVVSALTPYSMTFDPLLPLLHGLM